MNPFLLNIKNLILLFVLNAISLISMAQVTSETEALEDFLPAVVTVGVFETDLTKKTLGFRGNSTDMAYAKMLDLSGASGSGSGFFVKLNEKLYVITNAHVIEQASDANGSIYIYTINRNKYKAKVIGGDSFYDLAVLELDEKPGDEITYLKIRNAPAKIGERVYAIGNPLGEYPYSVSDGIISAKNRVRGGLTGKFGFLQTTATVIWGNSGGPLIDSKGNVLGINSQIAFATQGETSIWQPQINFALESSLAERLISDIVNNKGIIKRAFFGVEFAQKRIFHSPGSREYNYYSKMYTTDEFPVISKVPDDSPASILKSYLGYSVTAVNNEQTRNLEEILGEFEKCKPGESIKLSLKNKNEVKVVQVNSSSLTASGSEAIGQLFMKLAEAKYTVSQQKVFVSFPPEMKTLGTKHYITNLKNKQVDTGLGNFEWEVLGIGLISGNSESLWRVNTLADAGTAARLTGMSGVIDLVLFKKGTNPNKEENFIKKRILLSGEDNLVKQTLWY